MGVYFIAAGSGSDNRERTLDQPHTVSDLVPFLSQSAAERLKAYFPDGRGIYMWGANPRSRTHLAKVHEDEYVVDFLNQEVRTIFRFCFWIDTGSDRRLQNYVGWDSGVRSTFEVRPYPYVFFLSSPRGSSRNKRFLLHAFDKGSKVHFFDGQKYLDDSTVAAAMNRTCSASLEEFLGISSAAISAPPRAVRPNTPPTQQNALPVAAIEPATKTPSWLEPIIAQVKALWRQRISLERDHEDLVARFLEGLGYIRGHEIRFQRANIDISIQGADGPLALLEVKADRNLTLGSKLVLSQALGYAQETGVPVVAITNGDYYAWLDRRRGLATRAQLLGEFRLSSLDTAAINLIESLRRGTLR